MAVGVGVNGNGAGNANGNADADEATTVTGIRLQSPEQRLMRNLFRQKPPSLKYILFQFQSLDHSNDLSMRTKDYQAKHSGPEEHGINIAWKRMANGRWMQSFDEEDDVYQLRNYYGGIDAFNNEHLPGGNAWEDLITFRGFKEIEGELDCYGKTLEASELGQGKINRVKEEINAIEDKEMEDAEDEMEVEELMAVDQGCEEQ